MRWLASRRISALMLMAAFISATYTGSARIVINDPGVCGGGGSVCPK
jgi:hypothetical protein